MADATRMSRVLDIVHGALSDGPVVLVSSAVAGCTDALVEIGSETDPSRRVSLEKALLERHLSIVKRLFTGAEREEAGTEIKELFALLSKAVGKDCETFGELFSTRILARKFACEGVRTKWLDSRGLIIATGGSADLQESYRRIREAVAASPETGLFVVPGFIASDASGKVVTLGRGGSDYSAAIFAAALDDAALEIWTDVPGMMTANPKVVPSASTISQLSYEAALSLASLGAKVLYAPTVGPVMEAGIPFSIRNTFEPSNPGTLVCGHSSGSSWKGVTSQPCGEDEDTVSLVGEGAPEAAAQRVMSALSEAGIQPLVPVEEEGPLCTIKVRRAVTDIALAAVHKEFFERSTPVVIPVYIAGFGAVGKELVDLVDSSRDRIIRRRGRLIRICGLADSRRFVINPAGIEPSDAGAHLACAAPAPEGAFVEAVAGSAPRGSVFVDCTTSHTLYRSYPALLRRGINIVTSNRRSLAVPYAEYASLKAEASRGGAFFRYDTTVGNSLPILESLAGDANCTDGIESIKAVVSCTLNYLVTAHRPGGDSVAALLRRAQASGLTESDPRTDLGGRDVLRKLLVLAREAGVPLEEADVEIEPLLGPEFFDCTLEDFYSKLEDYEGQLAARERELSSRGLRERFVAVLQRDSSARLGYSARIRMEAFAQDSPFYWIDGTENVIEVRGERTAPLVVRGAGEGAREAAVGIIKDILS